MFHLMIRKSLAQFSFSILEWFGPSSRPRETTLSKQFRKVFVQNLVEERMYDERNVVVNVLYKAQHPEESMPGDVSLNILAVGSDLPSLLNVILLQSHCLILILGCFRVFLVDRIDRQLPSYERSSLELEQELLSIVMVPFRHPKPNRRK